MREERAYWLAWSQIPGIGSILLKRLQQHFGSLEEAWRASEQALREVDGFGSKLLSAVQEKRSQLEPVQFLEEHSKKNPHFWTPADPEYPQLLLEIPSSPPILYYRGKVEPQENQGLKPIVGIVGTRHPTEHGRKWTYLISLALAKSGFTVISGMAAGIDGEAHQACLEAGGRTIAVLGTGVDMVYPAHHRQLYERIQEQGLILSEYPAGTRADRRNFPPRNRIIAGLSRAVLVMEAPHKSGALITARFANEFGRDVYALPNSPDNQQAEGCLRLLRDGAEIIIEIGELLAMLGAIPQLDVANQQLSLFEIASNQNPSLSKPLSQPKITQIPELEPDLAKVWQATKTEATPFDAIVEDSALEASTVSAALLQLELMELVLQLPGMRYQRC